jgi:hypothetical protein
MCAAGRYQRGHRLKLWTHRRGRGLQIQSAVFVEDVMQMNGILLEGRPLRINLPTNKADQAGRCAPRLGSRWSQGMLSSTTLTQQRCMRGRSEGAGVATVGSVDMAAASKRVADTAIRDRRTQARRFPHVTDIPSQW